MRKRRRARPRAPGKWRASRNLLRRLFDAEEHTSSIQEWNDQAKAWFHKQPEEVLRAHPGGILYGTCYDSPDGRSVALVNRWRDWWDQSTRDLKHAGHAVEDADYEWAAFAGQQAAEKALKALIMSSSGEPWGHLTTGLAEGLPAEMAVPADVLDAARRLDKHYIPARYPNGFASGYPGQLYTRGEADEALEDATTIIEFCRRHLPR